MHRTIFILATLFGIAAIPAGAQLLPDVDRARSREVIVTEHMNHILAEKLKSHDGSDRRARRIASGDRKDDAQLLNAPEEIGITTSDEQEGELHAVINPMDSSNILVAAIRSSAFKPGLTLPIYFTKDFGATWTESSFSAGADAGGDPVFTAAADGTIYFSWIELQQDNAQGFYEGILWSSSTNGGESWTRPDTIAWSFVNTSGGSFDGTFADKQWMAVDRSNSSRHGAVYTSYIEIGMQQGQTRMVIVVRRKPAGAKEFVQTSADVSDPTWSEVQFSSVGVDDRGDVHVFFWGRDGAGDRHSLWHSVSRDGALTFGEATRVAPMRFPIVGSSVPDFLPQRLGPLPQFAVDGSAQSKHAGNMYAVWYSNNLASTRPGTTNEPFHVYFTRTIYRGATWQPPVRINDDTTSFRADHLLPSIDVSATGAVVVTWYDGRAMANNQKLHHYTAFSLDGGATFNGNVQVSTGATNADANILGGFGVGDYTKCLSTSRYAIPIWSDGRGNNGDLNIYAAFVPMVEGASGVEDVQQIGVARIAFMPNPATSSGHISVSMQRAANARIEIIDMQGRVVATPFAGHLEENNTTVDVDLKGLPAGSYVARIKGDRFTATAKLEIVR